MSIAELLEEVRASIPLREARLPVRLVFIAPPAALHHATSRFGDLLGVPPGIITRLERRIEDRFLRPIEDYDLLRHAPEMTQPLLVIHDRHDREVPLKAGEMSLHHILLVHGSKPNTTFDRRIGLAIRYIPTYVRQTKVADSATLVRGTDRSWAGWQDAALTPLAEAALLRYLAVAHFGRGRGEWVQGEAPPHWPQAVAEALRPRQADLAALWAGRGERPEAAAAGAPAARLAAALQPLLRETVRDLLRRLYPDDAPGAAPAVPAAPAGLAAAQSPA